MQGQTYSVQNVVKKNYDTPFTGRDNPVNDGRKKLKVQRTKVARHHLKRSKIIKYIKKKLYQQQDIVLIDGKIFTEIRLAEIQTKVSSEHHSKPSICMILRRMISDNLLEKHTTKDKKQFYRVVTTGESHDDLYPTRYRFHKQALEIFLNNVLEIPKEDLLDEDKRKLVSKKYNINKLTFTRLGFVLKKYFRNDLDLFRKWCENIKRVAKKQLLALLQSSKAMLLFVKQMFERIYKWYKEARRKKTTMETMSQETIMSQETMSQKTSLQVISDACLAISADADDRQAGHVYLGENNMARTMMKPEKQEKADRYELLRLVFGEKGLVNIASRKPYVRNELGLTTGRWENDLRDIYIIDGLEQSKTLAKRYTFVPEEIRISYVEARRALYKMYFLRFNNRELAHSLYYSNLLIEPMSAETTFVD